MLQANDLVAVAFPNATVWLLLEGALEAAAILAVGTVCALLARGASAAVRHMIWTLTLTGALIAPVVGAVLPQWRVSVPGWVGPAALPSLISDALQRPAPLDAVIAREVGATGGRATVTEPRAMAESHTVTESHTASESNTAAASGTTTTSSTATISNRSADVPSVAEVTATAVAPGVASAALSATEAGASIMARAVTLAVDLLSLATSAALVRGPISSWLVTVWLIGVVLALIPMMIGMARVSSLLRRAHPMRGGRWALLAPSAMREIDVRRRVRFLELDEPVMPMTSGLVRPVVLLPAGDFDSSIAQRLDVLRHELAHVRRHDCLTQFIAQLACAVNWFNPLAWLVARQMRIERERACDDEVLRAGAKASDYADYLLRVAQATRMSATAAFGALAMARPSQLAVRLHAVLDDGRRRERASPSVAFASVVGAVCVVVGVGTVNPAPAEARAVIALPPIEMRTTAEPGVDAVVASPDASVLVTSEAVVVTLPSLVPIGTPGTPAATPLASDVWTSAVAAILPTSAMECVRNAAARGKRSHSSSISSDDDSRRWRVRWSEGDCSYEVDARGEIRFNRDLTDIESISSGGSFTIEQHDGDESRRLTVRPQSNGTLQRTYWVNGERRDFDAAARAWLAEALVAIERRTAFAADQRVPAILQSAGVDGVLREVSLLEADHARRRYYTKLLSMRQLDASQVRRVVEQAGAAMSSDYELAELLVAVAKLDAFGDDAHPAFVTAVKRIDSDYEARRALNALLKRDRLAPATVEALLEAASTIDSDYELAELLIDVSRQYAINDRTRSMYIKSLGSIGSNYEHRRVLSAVIDGGGLTPDVTRALLEDARRISSDYELAEFLVAISAKGALGATTRDAYFAAADKIRSDHEHRRALMSLIKRDLLTKDIARGILASATRIASDYECAELLIAVANAITIDQDLRADFDRAAETIQGEYEYGRVMSAVRRGATR